MDLKVLRSQLDRAAAILLTIAGVVCLIAGYVGVDRTAILTTQTHYVVWGGIGGVFLLGLGATLWISADLRDEWRKLDRIEQALADGVLHWSEGTATDTGRQTDRAADQVSSQRSAADVDLGPLDQDDFAPASTAPRHA